MIFKLSDYILENTISDVSISDIALEQAAAEVNVNAAICEACMRQMYRSIYMEDGESSDNNDGTSFIDKVKRFFISIGNWFRRMVIKFSGWLSEKRVNAVLKKLEKMTEEEKKNTTFVLPTEDVQERYTNMVNEMQSLCDTLKNLDKNTGFLTAEELKKELQSFRTESKKKAKNVDEVYKYDYDTYYEAIKKFRDAINEKKNSLKTILNDIKKNPAEHFKIEDEKEAKKLYKVAKKYYDNFYTNITSSMTTLINCIKSAEKVLKKNPDSKDSIASGKRFRDETESIETANSDSTKESDTKKDEETEKSNESEVKEDNNKESDTKKDEETKSSNNNKANTVLDAFKGVSDIIKNNDGGKYFDEFVKSITNASDDTFDDVLNRSLQKLIFDIENRLSNTDFVKVINAIHKGTKYTDIYDWPLNGATFVLDGSRVKEIADSFRISKNIGFNISANQPNISVDDSEEYKVKSLLTPVMGYKDGDKEYIIKAKAATIELDEDSNGSYKSDQLISEDRVRRLEEVLGETLKLAKPLGDKKYWTTLPELYDEFKKLHDDTIKRFEHMRGKLNENIEEDDQFNEYHKFGKKIAEMDHSQFRTHYTMPEWLINFAMQQAELLSGIFSNKRRNVSVKGVTVYVATCTDKKFDEAIKELKSRNKKLIKYQEEAEEELKKQKDSAEQKKQSN